MDIMKEVDPPSKAWLEHHTRCHATRAEVDKWPLCKAYLLTSRGVREEAERLRQQYKELKQQQSDNVGKSNGNPSTQPPNLEHVEVLLKQIRDNELEQRLAESGFMASSVHGLEARDIVRGDLNHYPLR